MCIYWHTLCSYGIIADVDGDRIYWMECNTGDMKSALYNGSDIKTVYKTNSNFNWDIAINDDFIFSASNNQILKINKSPGQNATVVHTDANYIHGILFFEHKGKTVQNKRDSRIITILQWLFTIKQFYMRNIKFFFV